MKKALLKRKLSGAIAELHFPFTYNGYIVSEKYGDNVRISESGYHYGILYKNKIYCNIYPEGVVMGKWKYKFHAHSDIGRKVNYYHF